jgi:hypothetical protein
LIRLVVDLLQNLGIHAQPAPPWRRWFEGFATQSDGAFHRDLETKSAHRQPHSAATICLAFDLELLKENAARKKEIR